ncbi:MAG: hypothetical protein OHK0011_00940 [Turneriella sp.]
MSNPALDEDFGLGESQAVATIEHDAIADDQTLEQVERGLLSIADAGATVLSAAHSITVTDQPSADSASETAKKLNRIAKDIEEARKAAVKPFNDIVARINDYARKIGLPFSSSAKILSGAVITWQNAEAARIQAERRKLQQEQEAALLANKKPEPQLTLLPKEPPKPISVRTTYSYEIEDFDAVPKEYKRLVIDDEKLGRDVRSQAVKAIPGVKIIKTETPIFR